LLLTHQVVKFALLPLFLGIAVGANWGLAGRGTYRELNRLTKLRSAFAVSLYALFCFPVMAITYRMANAFVKQNAVSTCSGAVP
jgi:hypothetical protein